MQPVVVDTNIVVAGLIAGREASPVARILDAMLDAAVPFVVSEVLLAEYHAVLVRPPLRRLHGLSVADVERLLTVIARHAIVLAPEPGLPAPDPADQFLWDLLAARPDLLLVTGDKLLIRAAGQAGRVISAADFVAAMAR